MSDDLINRLAQARPDVSADLLEPNPALIEEILMTTPTPKRRFVTPLRLGAAAALATAAAAVAITLPNGAASTAHPSVTSQVAAPNMRRIVESTAAALSSGRAHVTYRTDNGHYIHDSGDFTIEFAGDNRSTVGRLDPGDPCKDASVSVPQERCDADNSFEIANKVVDGRFYLRDGAPGQQTWIEDTNEHLSGSDLFNADPRTLVAGADNAAQFRDVGAATVDGVATRHLKATRLDAVPRVNLGLGPVNDDKTKVTKFDVWVDTDDVVRRLDVSTSVTETVYPMARTILKKDAEGKVVGKSLDEANMGPSEQRTTVTDYSITFADIGADIVITAPANARQVAGKG
jgi:hypothetical protein